MSTGAVHPHGGRNDGAPDEAIRLVIWDLDETFWHGTLTEGGIRYRRDVHDMVVTLARRGIVSTICSKNDLAPVRQVLQAEGLWDYFVFPSIDWTPKGPRLRAMVDRIGLRPPTVLFIDDNPGNRAEAAHFVPGLRVASETIIPALLDDRLLQGKDDSGLSRLQQYTTLQSRHEQSSQAGGDTAAFLRGSDITVCIEHDLSPHLDRVVELINRTNQLNFTKTRLPEDAPAARAALRTLLGSHMVKAGLLRVRDRFGDHGFCGFYAVHHQHAHEPRLLHFCFSCRIAHMGVETWLYRRLGRPRLKISGEVLSDPMADTGAVDWITVADPVDGGTRPPEPAFDYVLLRGGCDIHTVAHYLGLHAGRVIAELHTARSGFEATVSHSIMLRHAIHGISAEAREAARPFGFADSDFTSVMADAPAGRKGAWVLSFAHDDIASLYRYKPTGELLPIRFHAHLHPRRSMIGLDPAALQVAPEVMAHLETWFEHVGIVSDAMFLDTLRAVLDRAPPAVRVHLLLGNERATRPDGVPVRADAMIHRNGLIREAAAGYSNAEALAIGRFFDPDGPPVLGSHYDRMVYFRVYRHIVSAASG